MKKILTVFVFMFFFVVSFCFSEKKFYRTKEGYSGYVMIAYQGMTDRLSIHSVNGNLFNISNAFGFFPFQVEKLSKSQWALFWAAYGDQYDIGKDEIYNAVIRVSGESQVLQMTFYDDGNTVHWVGFCDLSIFP